MSKSIFSDYPAIEIEGGIYRSRDENLFAAPQIMNWLRITSQCAEIITELKNDRIKNNRAKWMEDHVAMMGAARDRDEILSLIDQLVRRVKPNTSQASKAIRVLVGLWKAGAIVFPPAWVAINDTAVRAVTKNFNISTYIDSIKGNNGKVDSFISTLRKKRGVTNITFNRVLSRTLKGLLTLGPITAIESIPDSIFRSLTESAGSRRSKEFAFIGNTFFNESHATYERVKNDLKIYFDPEQVSKEDLRRSSPTCKWVTRKDPSMEEWRSALSEYFASKRQLKNLSHDISAAQHLLKYLLKHRDAPREIMTFLHKRHEPSETITSYILKMKLKSQAKGHYLSKISDFFEWCLDAYCSEPSEEDDLPIRLPEFRNPINPSDIPGQTVKAGQTHRLAMPYRYVEICIDIIKKNDFEWARSIDADYFETQDPGSGERVRMWSPVRAYALLLKFLLPLRTHQVRMLESGEGDPKVYDRTTGGWQKNVLRAKRHKHPSGFLKQIWDGEQGGYMTGLYVNTNKTKTRDAVDEGYSIPWQNEDVIELAARLQDWQIANHPLSRPTPYEAILPAIDGKPTEDVIAQTPSRYYLFRDPCGNYPEAPITAGRMRQIFLKLMLELEEELWRRGIKNIDGSKIMIISSWDKTGRVTGAIFDLHSLRVTGLTSFVKAGVPIHILSKLLAGHSSFLMTLYYAQMDIGYVTDILNKAQLHVEDQAGTELAQALQAMEMSEIRRLTANNSISGISAISSADSGLWSWMDWGICPVNGQKCDVGGEPVLDHSDRNYFGPVQGGPGNCPLCRFFITGPQFLIGLVAKFNETIHQMSEKGRFLREKREQRQKLLAERLPYEENGVDFPKERELSRATSALEAVREEWNTYAETLHAMYGLIEQSKAIAQKRAATSETLPLIKASEHEVSVSLTETNEWEVLDEVCRSARFYDSINWRNANLRRSNAFNLMMQRNGMNPVFIGLSDEVSKAALDSLSELLVKRLGRDNTKRLIDGDAILADLGVRDEFKTAVESAIGHSIEISHKPPASTSVPSPLSSTRRSLHGSQVRRS
ncbi:VPA1269 family protein [Sagittula sp.]|uniref:VPA1269 family protein n=1 Tax=Sagittula sp. TaxID=2038081 RepID=UPI0035164029